MLRRIAVPFVVAAGLLAPSLASAASNGADVRDVPYSFDIYNDCTQEMVHITGTLHRELNDARVGSGGFVQEHNYTLKDGSGLGASGTQYRVTYHSIRITHLVFVSQNLFADATDTWQLAGGGSVFTHTDSSGSSGFSSDSSCR